MPHLLAGTREPLLGPKDYLYLILTLALVMIPFALAGTAYSLYPAWCEEYYLPSVQQGFGFRVSRVHTPGFGWGSDPLVIVEVSPGGVLERAGFRPGDVPVEYHGGESAFCRALQEAEEGGDYRKVDVVNLDDWDRRPKRSLEIPRVR